MEEGGYKLEQRVSDIGIRLLIQKEKRLEQIKGKQKVRKQKRAGKNRKLGGVLLFLRRGKRKKHTLDMDYYGPEKEEATAVVAESMPDFNAGETVCFQNLLFIASGNWYTWGMG